MFLEGCLVSNDSRKFDTINLDLFSFDLSVVFLPNCSLLQLFGHGKLGLNVQPLHPVAKCLAWN